MSVFVSYASQDISHVNSLSKANNDKTLFERVSLWISYEKNKNKKNIEPGSNSKRKILEAIDKSTSAIIFVSNNLLTSDFVVKEELPLIFKKYNSNKNYNIIPVFVDKVTSYDNFPQLQDLQYSNSPSTALNSLSGAKYRITISELLSDLSSIHSKKRKQYFTVFSIFILFLISSTIFNNNFDTNTLEEQNYEQPIQAEIASENKPKNIEESPGTTGVESDPVEIEECLVRTVFLNYYADERTIFLLERHFPISSDQDVKGLSYGLNNINWKNKEDLDMYIFQYFAHHELYKSLVDANDGFYKEEINYIQQSHINNAKSDLFLLKEDLDLISEDSTFYTQTKEFVEVLDLFDLSLNRLLMYWKSAEDTDEASEEYSLNYLGESKAIFEEALNAYAQYKIKYYPDTFKFNLEDINKCGDVASINSSYYENVSQAVNTFYTRSYLFDLKAGDCFNMPEDFGFDSFQSLRGSGIFKNYLHINPVGWLDDMFPSYLPVSKVDCNSPHQVEVYFKGSLKDSEYNFNWVTGIPIEMDNRQEIDIFTFFNCNLEATLYLDFPEQYTGLFTSSLYDASRYRAEERDFICIFFKYDLDELGQVQSYGFKERSARLIKDKNPLVSGFDYTDNLLNLDKGICWIDPEFKDFPRSMIHNSTRTDYKTAFTYIGYNDMTVRVINCDKTHQNEVVYVGHINGSDFNTPNEISIESRKICTEEILKINYEQTEGYSLGIDAFIGNRDTTDQKISLVCSSYVVQEYSDLFHPTGYGDYFIGKKTESLFNK